MKAKKIKRETWRTTDAEERAKRQERAKVEQRIASFACGAGSVYADIPPVALEDLVCVRNRLMLSSEDALILQLAVQGLDLPNALSSAREFCARSRETWK